ncbi:peptidase C14, caspase domain-containing protein [Pseudomassariella vexata]|uniref:Peptidase C14, caspase domain-containing protein n=1 Tax=Pseudomassariella vexata TaxID=1141098 RepID=A0A1Y2DP45_9PEZI|nr:peptidase C14, caspase domain-containing protein [Pseudomassariella vexata]ORY60906.1 peptidase C14, caspase domain-containing protein [Pseudomassariella vexata]
MSGYLVEHFGYKREDMVILTDDQQNPMSQPTKQNILRAMHWLVKDARSNDSLFFHYSGHGGQTKDLDGDEPDGYDEVIYPVDFRSVGHITDDEMHRIMVKPLPCGVRLTAIFDSCHSGTALDLPYIYSTQGMLKEPNLAKEAGQGLLGVISSYSQGDLGGVAKGVMGFFKKATSGEDAHNKAMATKTSAADVIMFSGSKDDQTSFVFPSIFISSY